jgi:hypothetical protein
MCKQAGGLGSGSWIAVFAVSLSKDRGARPDGPTGAIGAVSAACEKVGEIVLLSAQVYIRSPPGSLFEGLILYKKVLYSASTGAYL